MGHQAKKQRDQDTFNGKLQPESMSVLPSAVLDAGESDDEYADIPMLAPPESIQESHGQTEATPAAAAGGEPPAPSPPGEPAREVPQVPTTEATDDDWLRSRTSRLLDLVGPDDPGFVTRPAPSARAVAPPAPKPQEQPHGDGAADAGPARASPGKDETTGRAPQPVDKTRLFLRNLSYGVTEDDIRDHFSTFGTLEEVCMSPFYVSREPRLL